MSIGKMNSFIDIISTVPQKDSEGFAVIGDRVVASVRAYKEDRHGGERWANMAAFTTANVLFCFREIPGVNITTALIISCADGRYRIVSTENVRGRHMYVEVLAEKIEPTVR